MSETTPHKHSPSSRWWAACGLAALICSVGPSTASADEATRGPSCGLDLVEDGTGGTLYLAPITGRKNISCNDARQVYAAARKLHDDNRLYCAKKSRYRKWTIRHIGPYRESLSARFTKGNQQFRIDGQGSCV